MPALQSRTETITIEQFERIPENERIEVFDGIIYDMASPSLEHQTILLEISSILNDFVKQNRGKCRVFPAPFDVKLSDFPLVIVQPDIMIVCDANKLDEKRCNGAPDFVIEIVSPSTASDDYIRKLYYYKKYGVREYWIVDPKRRNVTVNYFEDSLFNIQYDFFSTIRVNIYKDLYINFSSIVERLDI